MLKIKLSRDEILRRTIKYILHFIAIYLSMKYSLQSVSDDEILIVSVIGACTFVILDVYIPMINI